MLHAFLLTAMNCGMRYDELSKVRMEHFTATKYGIGFGIAERCKNSNSYRSYRLRRWPGKRFMKSILMDPLFAMSTWIAARRNRDGFLFCNIVITSSVSRLILSEPWPRKTFVQFMGCKFIEIGIGSGTVRAHSGDSPKRGGVQLLRFLGCKDAYIMNWFGMTGQQAYLRYTKGFNDISGITVPDFASTDDLIAHAEGREVLNAILDSEEMQ